MSQIIPIYIPTYINSAEYSPARVLPRLFFYNGLLDCEKYYIEEGDATYGGISQQQFAFPYFDNYNVVSGSFPTTDSRTLLFNNENAVYGEVPTETLYSEYWEKYISLLYNPKTRLLNCSAIIPLADYFNMELNDIVNFRGNYYHLRAINDYSLKTGGCTLQLLGPIISDSLKGILFPCNFEFSVGVPSSTTTTTTTTAGPTTTTTASPTTTTTTAPTTTTTSTTSTTTTTTTTAPTPGVQTAGLALRVNCGSYSASVDGVWYDISGNGNNGLVSGSPMFNSSSLGIAFNGSNNFVTFPSTLVASPSSSWTMQFYGSIYSQSVVNYDFFNKDNYTNGWDLIWDASNNRWVYRDTGFDMTKNIFTQTYASKSLWTFTGVEGGDITVYQNTTYLGLFGFSGQVNAWNDSSNPFKFGWNADADSTFFKGTVQELLVYNRTLNSAEIAANFFEITSQSCVVPAPTYCAAFNAQSGDVYPVVGANDSTTGILTNCGENTVYIYGVFNSGTNTSGTTSADNITIGSTILTFNNTISGSNQTFYTDSGYTLITGSLLSTTLVKQDGLTNGSTLRLGYATVPSGSITII